MKVVLGDKHPLKLKKKCKYRQKHKQTQFPPTSLTALLTAHHQRPEKTMNADKTEAGYLYTELKEHKGIRFDIPVQSVGTFSNLHIRVTEK